MTTRRRLLQAGAALGAAALVPALNPVSAAPDYGVFPDALNGAIAIESHSWWTEGLSANPLLAARHIHVGICAPRMASAPFALTVRVVTFRAPSVPDWLRVGWFGASGQPPEVEYRNLAAYEVPGAAPGERVYLVPVTVDPATARDGGRTELRVRANITHADLGGDRQFTTANAQIHLSNGKPIRHYRATDDPIGRGWYTGLNYANCEWNGYAALIAPGASRPLLSGVVACKFRIREVASGGSGRVVLDPRYHDGVGGTVIGQRAGSGDLTVQLDTRALANGTHNLFVEADESDSRGRHKGQLHLLFEVQN